MQFPKLPTYYDTYIKYTATWNAIDALMMILGYKEYRCVSKNCSGKLHWRKRAILQLARASFVLPSGAPRRTNPTSQKQLSSTRRPRGSLLVQPLNKTSFLSPCLTLFLMHRDHSCTTSTVTRAAVPRRILRSHVYAAVQYITTPVMRLRWQYTMRAIIYLRGSRELSQHVVMAR